MVALTLLAYVAVKKKCEVLTKEKVLSKEELSSKKNWRVSLLARFQMLESEERITSIASEELGMVKRAEPAIEIKVDKEKIERINKALEDSYE